MMKQYNISYNDFTSCPIVYFVTANRLRFRKQLNQNTIFFK